MRYISPLKGFYVIFIFSIFGEWKTQFCWWRSSSPSSSLQYFAPVAVVAVAREEVVEEVAVPGVWAVAGVEMVAVGGEIGAETMVETVGVTGVMGVTNMQEEDWWDEMSGEWDEKKMEKELETAALEFCWDGWFLKH